MRYVNLKLTQAEAKAVISALDCEIPTRHAAAHNNFGERCDLPRGQGAIDDEVPAMQRALAKAKAAMV
jgi:hypothetical protein